MIDRKISRFRDSSPFQIVRQSFNLSFLIPCIPTTLYTVFPFPNIFIHSSLPLRYSTIGHSSSTYFFLFLFFFFSSFHSLLPPLLSSSPFSFFFFSHPLPPSTEGRSTRVHDETFIALPYFFSSHRVLTLLVPLHTRFSKYEIRTDPSTASRSSS